MKEFLKSKLFYSMPKSIISEKKDLMKGRITEDLVFRIAKFGGNNPDKFFIL